MLFWTTNRSTARSHGKTKLISELIPVTKAFIPPHQEYFDIVSEALQSGWITNRGELVKRLEKQVEDYLDSTSFIAMTNGTIPIQIALSLLAKGGEVITTPFSYVATTSSIIWQGCTPKFVDIDPTFLTIDETKIESAISDQTTCILATHVFGNPCNLEVIERIAKAHDLKVIYDAAHCFGVRYNGESLLNFGDVSTCSFHATKVFHTGEGGAFFSQDPDLLKGAFSEHNFGHRDNTTFDGLGINGKMSELQAAMGLAVLSHMEPIIEARKSIINSYDRLLQGVDVQTISVRPGTDWNYSYYPVIFKTEGELNRVMKALEQHDIHPRRYFYPSLNTLPYIEQSEMPISESIASRIVCLPLFVGLEDQSIELIAKTIKSELE